MKQFIKDYFSFNKRERNGILILMAVLIIAISIPYLLPLFIPTKNTDFSAFKNDIEKFEKSLTHIAAFLLKF